MEAHYRIADRRLDILHVAEPVRQNHDIQHLDELEESVEKVLRSSI